MSTQHEIQQGEHLTRVAAQYGFADVTPIWDHPDNAELKEKRGSPDVLAPGDVVVIPDADPGGRKVATTKAAHFRLTRAPVRLTLRIVDVLDQPLANHDFELVVEGKSSTVTSDGDGVVSLVVPPHAEKAELRDGDTTWELRIGHLDPIDTPSGVAARLNNLGYFVGDQEADQIDEDQLKFAIELFQNDHGLAVDGKAEGDTLDQLREVYGS